MKIVYLSDAGFVPAVKELNAELRAVDGKMRWICKDEKGKEYMIRPEIGRKEDEDNKTQTKS